MLTDDVICRASCLPGAGRSEHSREENGTGVTARHRLSTGPGALVQTRNRGILKAYDFVTATDATPHRA
jgi:hypothetical protein